MSFFSKPKVVLWPKARTTEIYLDKKENNSFSFDISLWEEHSDKELESIAYYLKQNRIDSCSVLVPDDVVLTKSFIYDTKITQIEKNEVIGLAESFVHFKIEPDTIEYSLTQETDKTIIRASIYEKKKIDILKLNLNKLGVKISSLRSVSSAVVEVVSGFNTNEFFLIYPLNEYEYTLILSKNGLVYLTANLKGPNLDIQKIINYSNLYFATPARKLYVPEHRQIEINCTTKLDQTPYSESQIAQSRGKASNLPLAVLGEITASNQANAAIIKKPIDISSSTPTVKPIKSMENKKNILPIVAVFIFTAALASVIIWFVLNRNKTNENLETPASEVAEETAPTTEPEITEAPTPIATIAELDKSIKIQVLNATDINGQAATIKTQLTSLGFKSIATGNGQKKATENTVQIKASLEGAQGYFESKMGSSFPATYTTDLKESSTYDVVFIIGTDLSTGAAADSSVSSDDTTVTPTKKVTATPTKTTTKPSTATPTDSE
jgi:hypothetical protein